MLHQIAIVKASDYKKRLEWGQVVNGWKVYACTDPQLDILASKAKYTFAFAGTGGGKTCLVPLWLYKQLSLYLKTKKTDKPWRGLIVSPTNQTFDKSQLKEHLINTFANTVLEGTVKRTNSKNSTGWQESKKKYILPHNLGEIVVITAEDDPRRLSGGQYNAIVADECWQMKSPEIWAEIRRRSNVLNAPVLGVTTPNCDGWLYEEVYLPWEKGDPEYYVRQWASSENPVKTPEQHEQFLASERLKLGQAMFDRMYGGQFSQLTGLVYPSFTDKTDKAEYPVISTQDRLPSPAVRVFGSVDWGYFPDPLSVYVYVHCENDIVYIVEELYGTRIEVDDLGRKLKALQDKWSTNYESKYADQVKGGFFEAFYCDTSRPEVRRLMSKFGVSIANRKVPLIDAGIITVDQLFRAHRVKVFDCCTNLIREAHGYAWDKNKPRAGNDHAMDSLRYGLSSYFHDRPITYLPAEVEASPDAEIEVARRLGHAESIEDLEELKRKAERDKQAAWMTYLMTCEDI